jgi:ketopantoate reductase
MRFAVFGLGAIGTILGVSLSKPGTKDLYERQVWLFNSLTCKFDDH